MKKRVNDILINQQFSYFTDILNKGSKDLNLKIKFGEYNIDSELDENMFLRSGYILMILYILNANFNGEIKYNEGIFYIKDIEKSNTKFIDSKVENIIEDIINKSIYYKSFLPNYNEEDTAKNIKDIETGFERAYKFFIDKKQDLIKDLDPNKNIELINMLKILSYNDLEMQRKFLRIKFRYPNEDNLLLNKLKGYENCDNSFVESSCKFLDSILEKSIIGMDKHGLEMMWIQYDNGKIVPTKFNNIYIAIYLKFISMIEDNKYYLESAKQTINPLLSEEYQLSMELFKILYLNKNFLDYDGVKEYIRKNESLAESISYEDKEKLTIDTEKKAMKFIKDKTFNVLDNIIT